MNTIKLLAVLTVIIGSVALVLGTGAFSAINADRLAGVGVAGDDSALLGVGIDDRTVQNNQEFTLVTVENRFDDELDSIDVTIVDDGGFNQVWITDTPEPLAEGESGDIRAQVVFGSQSAGVVQVRIEASGPDGSVELTREVFVQRSAPTLCTIDNDDRIGEWSFEEDVEFFDCTIRIDSDRPYEVEFEDSTVTGGFELFTKVLQEFEFDGNEIGGTTEIEIANTVNDDMEFEEMLFHDDVSVTVDGPANDISLDDSTVKGVYRVSVGNLNGAFEIESSDIDGDVRFESNDLNGGIETEETTIGGDYEITITRNVNSDISIEETNVDGDLVITIDGNLNGDISIDDSSVGGDLTIIVTQNANGDIDIGGTTVEGTVTSP